MITRCPQGVLVQASCLLGALTCKSRPTGAGAMVILAPCSRDRTPIGSPWWLGPIEDNSDVTLLCDFVERGKWEVDVLPDRLRVHRDWIIHSSRTN